MRSVFELAKNENLTKLMEAQRHFNKAAELFNEVFGIEGHPNETEELQEAFFKALSNCEMKMERLVGAVVYNDIFVGVKYSKS